MPRSPISKSCDPQLLNKLPEESWDLETLAQYSRAQGDRINQAEQTLSLLYWRLGAALTYARRHFDHGQWSRYLEQLGIDRTRASKARAIFRTFRSEQFVAGLSVDEAYSKRKRTQKRVIECKHRPENVALVGERFLGIKT